MHVEARAFRQPATNGLGPMRAVIVQDEMYIQVSRNGTVDGIQELTELGAALPAVNLSISLKVSLRWGCQAKRAISD